MSILGYKCQSTIPQRASWFDGATAPSGDGIHCVNPQDPATWAYVSTTSNTFSSNYNGAANPYVDPNLGSVTNECEPDSGSDAPSPPSVRTNIQGQTIPYLNMLQDCPPSSFFGQCPLYPPLSFAGNGGGSIDDFPGANSYGVCGRTLSSLKVHNWWMRDWDTELSTVPDACSTPTTPTTSLNTPYCCQLSPATTKRSQQCPPDVWGLSSKCYGPMTTSCAEYLSPTDYRTLSYWSTANLPSDQPRSIL